jgi:hypothetical protein
MSSIPLGVGWGIVMPPCMAPLGVGVSRVIHGGVHPLPPALPVGPPVAPRPPSARPPRGWGWGEPAPSWGSALGYP